MSAIGRNALDEFAGLPAGRGVIDLGDDIGLVIAADQERAVEPNAARLARQAYIGLVPHTAAAEQQREPGKLGIGGERRVEMPEMQRLRRLLDRKRAMQDRAFGEARGEHVVAPVAALPPA